MASKLDEIFATAKSTRKLNRKVEGSFSDDDGRTRFVYTNNRLNLEGEKHISTSARLTLVVFFQPNAKMQ